ncbi:MAG TPA: hypothetical protein VFT97_06040 [Candidatus Eisenbacteria bacterium]|nr:hypothetical protein [Candidatus Eisenbacteria bacterium]
MTLLDPDGRLVHLSTVPTMSDQAPSEPTGETTSRVTDWPDFVSAAGYDAARMTPVASGARRLVAADSVTACVVPGPGASDGPITLHATWLNGRVERFWIDAPWGTSRDPLALESSLKVDEADRWLTLAFFTIIPILAAVLFAVRNLRAGRGDRRGALRLALFTFVIYLIGHALALNVSELGLGAAVETLVRQAPIGHALLHCVIVWFLYMALEPYLRRIWPRVMVSWARLISGRLRDPMIGRDILVAFVLFSATVAVLLTTRAVIGRPPGTERFVGGVIDSLSGGGAPLSGFTVSTASVSQIVMAYFTILLIFRVLFRRNWAAIAGSVLFFGGLFYVVNASRDGPIAAAITTGIMISAFTFVALRFGFLAALISGFLLQNLGNILWTTDLSAWYAGRMLFPVALFGALMVYGFLIALGGRSIFRDPIGESG